MPRGNHAQSIASNGGQGEDKKSLQRSQLRQHGEFRHVSASEWEWSRLCGQNLCGSFVRVVLAMEVVVSARAMAADGTTKRSYLQHQGEFQHKNCVLGSLHDSDHDGVGRSFVAIPKVVKGYIIYITLHGIIFPLPGV